MLDMHSMTMYATHRKAVIETLHGLRPSRHCCPLAGSSSPGHMHEQAPAEMAPIMHASWSLTSTLRRSAPRGGSNMPCLLRARDAAAAAPLATMTEVREAAPEPPRMAPRPRSLDDAERTRASAAASSRQSERSARNNIPINQLR